MKARISAVTFDLWPLTMRWKPHVEDSKAATQKKFGSLMIVKLPYQLRTTHFQTLLPKTKWSSSSFQLLLLWVCCHLQLNLTIHLLPSCSFSISFNSSEPLPSALAPGLFSLSTPLLFSGFTSRFTQELYSPILSVIYFEFWYWSKIHLLQPWDYQVPCLQIPSQSGSN